MQLGEYLRGYKRVSFGSPVAVYPVIPFGSFFSRREIDKPHAIGSKKSRQCFFPLPIDAYDHRQQGPGCTPAKLYNFFDDPVSQAVS